MTTDPIVRHCVSARRQSSVPDDLSLSLSRSSSYNDFNQFLDNMLGLDSSDCPQLNRHSSIEREQLDDSFHHQWEFDLQESSAGGNQKITSHNNSRDTEREQAGASKAPEVIVMPLGQWNETESIKTTHADPQSQRKLQQASMLRKIAVGFGIGKLLQCISQQQESPVSNYSWSQLQSLCAVDNFVVESVKCESSSEPGWEVTGVAMITPFLSLKIDTSSLPSDCNSRESDKVDGIRGKHVVAAITSPFPSDRSNSAAEDVSDSESLLCHLLGVLLRKLFTHGRYGVNQHHSLTDEKHQDSPANEVVQVDGPSAKKKSLENFPPAQRCVLHNNLVNAWKDSYPHVSDVDFSQGISILGHKKAISHGCSSKELQVNLRLSPLTDFGFPSNLSQLVKNLVDCGSGLFRPDDSYRSLGVAVNDMQVLLSGPSRFLFDGPPSKGNAFLGNERLYGRSKEIASLKNAFWRVASSGESESIFVGGFSGCGKTRLVLSILDSVRIAGGYAVTKKFDKMQSASPLAIVLSAFNEMCISVAKKLAGMSDENIPETLKCHTLFGPCSAKCGRSPPFSCYTSILKQSWADCMSLRLMQSVLSDMKGFNCMLFVGGFRDNEVEQDHVLVEFFTTLSTFNIKTSMISLHGINTEDVNAMISDTLGIFPRTCKSLSDIVSRKTNGNPYFALEFLRSLIDRDLITYSLRDKHWKWDINQIGAENITDNVLYILTNKMSVLEDSAQTALKVASCFGIHLSVVITKKLAAAPQFHNLQSTLDQVVVKDGFMDFDGFNYRFVHDKVREAAYGLIPPVEKDQYHFIIGMALQSNFASLDEEDTSVLFATIDQINRCPPTMFRDDSQRILIANLNYEAGVKAMKCSNFVPAHAYMNAAVSLLPENSWKSHYDLSLKCNYHFAKAAYSCGYVDQAKEILDEVIEHGEGLEDKSQYMLDSYSLLVSLFYLARKDLLQAFHTCLKVLNLLGEDLPINGNVDEAELISIVTKTKTVFQEKSNEELMAHHEETSRRNIAIMQFYDQLSIVSYLAKPKICPYVMARWAHFCLTHNVSCKYTPGAFVSFSSILCCESFDEDARIACRIGKVGMLMLSRNDSAIEELPGVYLIHYVYAGSLIEPIQACVNMMRHAYEIGMQTGDPSKAAFNLSIMVAKQIKAGTNLLALKRDIGNYSKLATQYAQKQLRCNLLMMNKIVSRLIGDDREECSADEKDIPAWEESEFSLEMMTSFYLGHMERVCHKSKLWEDLDDSMKKKVPFRVIYIGFFSGLASASLYSYGKKNSQRHLSNVAKSLEILEKAANFSVWNFKNKASLLRATMLAITAEDDAVIQSEFNRAILASRSSKFVHEEGLACELAGMHYKKRGMKSLALSFFHQAELCYKSWGSHVKVRQMVRQIELMHG
ncbi:hypothetical protein HJC23_002447 [Cyclotella cryptica]|uniref:Orc1-like AAA ATPase domain-containing protein n=1 Tax=Cyclotella cryptica TaxID=29204 RepID=A0ABD3PVN8_9STRA